jgi:trigger factor
LERKLSPEEAEVEYAKLKEDCVQLIEGRAMAQSDIKITFEDLNIYYKNIRQQMAQFGQANPTDEEFKELLKSFV